MTTTINENTRRKDIVIAGSATLVYDFPILNETDIKVLQDGVLLTLNTHYSVTGVGADAGGTVVLVTLPANGTKMTLLGAQVAKQVSTYTTEAFPPSRVQNDFNKRAIGEQQNVEAIRRALRAPENDNLDMTVPALVTRASKILGFDAGGLPTALSPTAYVPGAVALPLSLANGGTGVSNANTIALAKALTLALWKPGANIVAAATVTFPDPLDGNEITITGNTGITAFSQTGISDGTVLYLRFSGTPLITNGAALQLAGATNFQCSGGETLAIQLVGGVWRELFRVFPSALANAARFWRGDGTWASPAGTLQTFSDLRLRTHPDNDKFKTQMALLGLRTVIMSDGARYDNVVVPGIDTPLIADITVSGAGGRDTGAEVASTWYSVRLVGKSSTGLKSDLRLVLHREKDYLKDTSFETTPDTNRSLRLATGTATDKIAQGFQLATTSKVEFIDASMARVGAVSGNIWFTIEADSGGNPSGTPLATSDKFNAALISSTVNMYIRFPFRVPATLTSATQYHLVLQGDYTRSDTVFINWNGLVAGGYASGSSKDFNGTVWGATPGANGLDRTFRVFVTRNDTTITFPSGYDQECKLGFVYNNSGSDFNAISFVDRKARALGTLTQVIATSVIAPTLGDASIALPPISCTAHIGARSGAGTSYNWFASGVPDGYGMSLNASGDWDSGSAHATGSASFNLWMGHVVTEYQAIYAAVDIANSTAFYIPAWEW